MNDPLLLSLPLVTGRVLTFVCSLSFCPPKTGELMRKQLFQEVILGEASLFYSPFVPCLWTEHKGRALSNLTGVSGIQLLGTSLPGFA